MMFYLFLLLCFSNILALSAQTLEFSIEPKSVVVREGSPAILNCKTKNSSGVSILWKKGKEWIIDTTNKSYSLLRNGSLFFPSVGRNDEDKYICAAILLHTNQRIYSKIPAYITIAYIKSNFIRPPSSITLREHKTALLTCITGASQPLANVKWEKDGQAMIIEGDTMAQSYIIQLNATSGSLQLKNVSLADTGYYACIATNPLLPNDQKKSPQALLLVLPKDDEPRIEVTPVHRISRVNSPLQMDCSIVGVPPPVIYWLHNGLKVDNTSDRKVYSNGSLFFKPLSRKHEGWYSCNGTNNKGSIASPNIFLYVAYIDYHFKQNPKNKTAVNGSKVELKCQPPPHYPLLLTYKWYKNYRVVTVNDRRKILPSGSLMFTHVLKSDEGVYVCEARNEYSRQTRTSTAAYLTVNVPPYFLITPSNQTVILYDELHFTCVPQGSPPPHVLWYHGNTLLSNSSTVYLGGDGSLRITSVETSDAGVYECRIENVAGSRTAVAFVDVQVAPNVTIKPRNTSVVLANDASLFCQFAGNPPPTLRWYFHRDKEQPTVLSRNSSRFIQTKEQLRILNVTEQDKGWYSCVARNIIGLQNVSAYLNVLVPAYLTEVPQNTTVNETGIAVMKCRHHGNPQPITTWSKNGHLLSFNDKTTFNGTHLVIRNTTRNDSGVYSCTVENKLGKDTSSAHLTVQVSPTIQAVLGPSRTKWKNNVSFRCKFDGIPKPEVGWLKDGDSIVYTRRIFAKDDILNIMPVRHNDTGNYTCKVSNKAGSATRMKQLIVEIPPCRPVNLVVENISSMSVQVLWKSSCDGYSPITSFRLETTTNYSSSSWKNVSNTITTEHFNIQNLQPYTLYKIRVFSKNKIGWSKASESIALRTNEDSPSTPVDLKCLVYNTSTVHLTWRTPSRANGIIRQYRVKYKRYRGLDAEETRTTPEMSYIINRLNSYVIYAFRVQAATGIQSFMWGNYTSYIRCRTAESAPTVAPQNVSLVAVGSNTILIRWQVIPAGSMNGIIRKHCAQYRTTSEMYYSGKIKCISGNKTTQYNISGLKAWTSYVVQISAVTIAQGPWSEEGTSRTFDSEPSGAPTNVLVRATSSQSLSVKWDPPSEDKQNGVLIGYTVLLYRKDNPALLTTNVTTNKTSIEIFGLLIYTSYQIQIRAFTVVGYGPLSYPKDARTGESYPGVVDNLTKTIINDSILVRWQPPQVPNGNVTSYILHYNATIMVLLGIPSTNITVTNITTQTQTITTHHASVILSGIHGNVTYSLCVAAKTSAGYGNCSKPIIFVTNFSLTTWPTPGTDGEFTPSIVDDHLPLIAGGATIFVIIVIALFTCWIVRKKNRENEEKQAKLTYNFRGHAFPMDSYEDGGSSFASHGSKPINGYSMDSVSLNSRTNTSNAFASNHEKDERRLRDNSLCLSSDASSYDDAYSSVVEVGVDATTVDPIPTSSAAAHIVDQGHIPSSYNPLYVEAQLHGSFDENCSANPIYQSTFQQQQQPHVNAMLAQDTNKSDLPSTIKLPSKAAQVGNSLVLYHDPPSQDSMEGSEYFSSDEFEEVPNSHRRYDVLVLPPPPPEFADNLENNYKLVEQHKAFDNAVTDF